jgi:hypothetical protein
MSSSTHPPPLTPEQAARFHDTRQPALWASLSIFLVINNVTIAGRLWANWKTGSRRMPVMAEGVTLVLSGVSAHIRSLTGLADRASNRSC